MNSLCEFIDILREQRHDFMNELQIIYGYLQIQKEDNAREYIKELSERSNKISELYSLGDNILGYILELNIRKLWLSSVKVSLDIEISRLNKEPFLNEYNKKFDLVNNIFKEIKHEEIEMVYVYFFEDDIGQSLLISNDESMLDEINWMENWDELHTDISDLQLCKCNYGENIAYRIIFL
ncbi:Spo0B domain-containing protein [Clostridium rectalis]|uniref:Spo0B domain-containing protein n=1 Tax=Clostridium rectalis TaxID=2040295 RepID=UPI000F6423DB|nr:Spo0B domain-containing protein [Clostridium rectalis]